MKDTYIVGTIEIYYQDMGEEDQGPDMDQYTGYYYTLNNSSPLLGSPCVSAKICLQECAKGWDKP